MTLNSPLSYAALGLACAIMSMQARAVDLYGTFAGTVRYAQPLPHTHNPPHPESYYEGAEVSGSFALNVTDPELDATIEDFKIFNDAAGTLSVSYLLKGVNYSLSDDHPHPPDPSDILLYLFPSNPGDTQQSMDIRTSSGDFYLVGPSGSLYSGLDPNTIHVDPAVTYTGATSFFAGAADMTFYVDITQMRFQTATLVPEPVTSVLFIAGGGLLAWRLRRRTPLRLQR